MSKLAFRLQYREFLQREPGFGTPQGLSSTTPGGCIFARRRTYAASRSPGVSEAKMTTASIGWLNGATQVAGAEASLSPMASDRAAIPDLNESGKS